MAGIQPNYIPGCQIARVPSVHLVLCWMGCFKLMILMQLNTSDIHAGELYILEDDPGEDNNVYKFLSDKVAAKLANLTVSGV